jgi:hypothetical protein
MRPRHAGPADPNAGPTDVEGTGKQLSGEAALPSGQTLGFRGGDALLSPVAGAAVVAAVDPVPEGVDRSLRTATTATATTTATTPIATRRPRDFVPIETSVPAPGFARKASISEYTGSTALVPRQAPRSPATD